MSGNILPAGTKLRMTGDRILIRPLEWDASKIIIAIRDGRPVRGEVVAVGPGRHPIKYANGRSVMKLSNHFQPTEVKVGDIVELGGLNIFDGKGYQFPELVIGTETFLVITERDVAGIREPEFTYEDAMAMDC